MEGVLRLAPPSGSRTSTGQCRRFAAQITVNCMIRLKNPAQYHPATVVHDISLWYIRGYRSGSIAFPPQRPAKNTSISARRPACALREKRLSAAASVQLRVQLLTSCRRSPSLFADGVFITIGVAAGKQPHDPPQADMTQIRISRRRLSGSSQAQTAGRFRPRQCLRLLLKHSLFQPNCAASRSLRVQASAAHAASRPPAAHDSRPDAAGSAQQFRLK